MKGAREREGGMRGEGGTGKERREKPHLPRVHCSSSQREGSPGHHLHLGRGSKRSGQRGHWPNWCKGSSRSGFQGSQHIWSQRCSCMSSPRRHSSRTSDLRAGPQGLRSGAEPFGPPRVWELPVMVVCS